MQLFIFELPKKLISPQIFVPSASQGQRQLAELSGYSHAHSRIYEARRFDELSRGSLSRPHIDAQIKLLLVEKYHNR